MFDETIIKLLNREKYIDFIKNKLIEIEKNINNSKQKRGFFIYGKNGIGKTELINYIINKIDYCKINFDGFDNRNKNMIENLEKINVSNYNIMSMFKKKLKKNIIVMDDIEIMNIGDKGGINTLVKMIRPKKTKLQLQELQTNHPIICICDEKHDKKLNELRKNCYEIHIEEPTNEQIIQILKYYNIDINYNYYSEINNNNKSNKIIVNNDNDNQTNNNITNILLFINNNLYKLYEFIDLYKWNNIKCFKIINQNLKQTEKERIKELNKDIYLNKYSIEDYSLKINETDKTSLCLLLHENIHLVIEFIKKYKKLFNINNKEFINIIEEYNYVLNKYSFIDYYDRIIFQKQIWILNDITALLKIKFINNFIQNIIIYYNITYNKFNKYLNSSEIQFTKVLTKYTSQYNNKLFLNSLSNSFNLDINDLYYIFLNISYNSIFIYKTNNKINELDILNDKNLEKIIDLLLHNNEKILNISKLYLKRILKFCFFLFNEL